MHSADIKYHDTMEFYTLDTELSGHEREKLEPQEMLVWPADQFYQLTGKVDNNYKPSNLYTALTCKCFWRLEDTGLHL